MSRDVRFGVLRGHWAASAVRSFEPLAGGARGETAYRALFGVLTLVLIAAVAIYSRAQDVRPSDEMRGRQQRDGAGSSPDAAGV